MEPRPEWLFDDPPRASVDAIWDHIGACLSHVPHKRPTATTLSQSLDALAHGAPREMLKRAGNDTSLPQSIALLFAFQPRRNSSTSIYDPTKSRRARVEERLRHLSHLLRPESATGEGCIPEMEIFGQRKDRIKISDGITPYLTSTPIPDGKKLKKVVITVVSKDQRWPGHAPHRGTYEGAWTWFELSVGTFSGDSERWRGEVVRNLHGHAEFVEHRVEISDKGLYAKAESGDVLTVWACAKFPHHVNTVREVAVYCAIE